MQRGRREDKQRLRGAVTTTEHRSHQELEEASGSFSHRGVDGGWNLLPLAFRLPPLWEKHIPAIAGHPTGQPVLAARAH